MKGLVVVLALFAGSAAASTKDPFDGYMASIKNHQPEARLTDFAKSCGVSLDAIPVYGVSTNGKWYKTTNLAKGVYNTESDYFATAAIWSANGKARLIDFWSLSLDIGSEINVLYCLSPSGRVRIVDVVNNTVPMAGESVGWIYKQRIVFDVNGKTINKSGHFVDALGRTVKKPKLDEDDSASFDWIPEPSVVLDIEKALLARH